MFSDSKTVDSPFLNRAGAQPFRAISARILARLGSRFDGPATEDLARTGIVVLPDFLPDEEFAELHDETDEYAASGAPDWVYRHGTSRVDHWSVPPPDGDRFPRLTEWSNHPRVIPYAAAAEQRHLPAHLGLRVLEHLHLGDYVEPDDQCELHVDAFFNTHKLWLYLDDVTPDRAPLVYIPGSHRLDRARLRGDYLESIGTNRGSRRISEEELSRRGLEPFVVTCPRNTLVLANTCGYHCRSVGAPGALRRSLHMAFRSNPFSIRRRFSRSG